MSSAQQKESKMDFVNFNSRNWSFKGDRGSWIGRKNGKLVVKKAAKGIVSSEYAEELRVFCKDNGIDWDAIPCGGSATVEMEHE
jgi:hypothetical protein